MGRESRDRNVDERVESLRNIIPLTRWSSSLVLSKGIRDTLIFFWLFVGVDTASLHSAPLNQQLLIKRNNGGIAIFDKRIVLFRTKKSM